MVPGGLLFDRFASEIACMTGQSCEKRLLFEGQNTLTVGRIAAVNEVECSLCVLEVPSVGNAAAQIDLALVDQIDHVLELAVLQAAAADVQLLGD